MSHWCDRPLGDDADGVSLCGAAVPKLHHSSARTEAQDGEADVPDSAPALTQRLHRMVQRAADAPAVDAEGYVTVVDRLKDIIITGGENVYSAEV